MTNKTKQNTKVNAKQIESLKNQVKNLKVRNEYSLFKFSKNKVGNKNKVAASTNGTGWLSSIWGSGDYRTNFGTTIPAFPATTTVITHREYLQDITSSANAGAFKIDSFSLNPGLQGSFPWLSAIANNYEEYEISGMVYEFKTTSGTSVASTNTALGSVILTTQYDPTKPVFTDKQEMENYEFSQSGAPFENILHAVEAKKSLSPVKLLYIRDGTLSTTGNDLRWTDFGRFSIATVGMQGANVNLGELWVSYKILLRKPRLPSGGPSTISQGKVSRGIVTGGYPFGTVSLYQEGTIGVLCSPGNFTFDAQPQDYYLITMSWIGASVNFSPPSLSYSNLILAPESTFFNGNSSSYPTNGTAVSIATFQIVVKCLSVAGVVRARVQADVDGLLPTTHFDLTIVRLHPSLIN